MKKTHYYGGCLKTDKQSPQVAACRKNRVLEISQLCYQILFRLQELNTTSLALASSGVAKVEKMTLAFSFAFSIMKGPR